MKKQSSLFWCAFVLAVNALPALCQNWNIDYVSSKYTDYLDDSRSVAVQGNYAYIATSRTGLVVVNISNPNNPFEVNRFDTPDWANDVAISGDIAYIADGSELAIIDDISNPFGPHVVVSISTQGWANSVFVTGDRIYIANGNDLLIWDAINLVELGSCDNIGWTRGVTVAGNYAYVASGENGMYVVDVSNPSNPVEVGQCLTNGEAENIAISGNYAYVADGDGGLTKIYISTPAYPQMVANVPMSDYATDIAIFGNYAYVADNYFGGLRVVNLSTLEMDSCSVNGPAQGVFVLGNFVYVAASFNTLQVVDISNSPYLQPRGSFNPYGTIWNVAVANDYSYLANLEKGVYVVDIANPYDPEQVDTLGITPFALDVAVSGDYLYVVNGDGLQAYDISDPTNAIPTDFCETPGFSWRVAADANHAYVCMAWENGGLQIINTSNPSDLFLEGSVPIYNAQNVAVSGNYAYVAAGDSGLRIIDVIDHQAPWETGHWVLSSGYNYGEALDVAVYATLAFVAYEDDGLRVINVGNPMNPQEAWHFDCYDAQGVTIWQHWVLIAEGSNGIRVVDFQNPNHPEEGFYDTPGYAGAVAAADSCAYVADYTGFQILDWSDAQPVVPDKNPTLPLQFSLNDPFPNPFNSQTKLSFTLPNPAEVALVIYDMQGKEVANLVNRRYDRGEFEVTFDAGQLPSGIYFARLTAGDFTQTQKLLLLK